MPTDLARDDIPFFADSRLLESEIFALLKKEGVDPFEMSILFQVNDVDVVTGSFNDILKQWAYRMQEQVKEDSCFGDLDAAAEKRARQLVKEKLEHNLDVLNDIDLAMWRLDA